DAADGTPAALRLVVAARRPAPGLSDAIRPEDRWALEAARLRAVSRGRVRETRESQRRIVAAADSERLRLERDLHDGTQQRLVAAAVQMSIARIQMDPSSAATVADAEDAVRQALSGLRQVARDNLAETLTAEGLRAAVEETVAGTTTTTRLTFDLNRDDLPLSVQRAVAEAVAVCLANTDAHARATRAWVDLAARRDEAVLEVGDDGRGGARPGPGLTLVSDRVEALGGTFVLRSPPGGGTVVNVRLPCGW
ncbi:MAG TPA: histidine kinase, partial [Candidatus Nanopelagicales bacterium]|nr:histidine kinase [Candidatus Nanopelagicales bacterium]